MWKKHFFNPKDVVCVFSVTLGGAPEEDRGGAAEQQPVCGDPQWEHGVADGAGGERSGAEDPR